MSVVPWAVDPEHRDQFHVINPSIWQDREPPQREWMVEDVATKGSVVLLSGDGGVGKSLILQQLLSSAAIGASWLDLRVEPGKGLLLSCEDDVDELWRRQAKINRNLDCSMVDVCEGGFALKPRVGQRNALAALNRQKWEIEPTPLFTALWDYCEREGVQYVGIDTATATFGGNQNDESQVSGYVTLLRRLAMKIQGVVFLTKHPSVTGRANGTGESGSVAWTNSVRSRIYLTKDKNKNLVLKTMKSNYGRSDGEIPIKWQDGVFVIDKPNDVGWWVR